MKLDSKIYLAGHSGLIGSAFLRRFQRDGFQNIVTMPRQTLDLTVQSAVNNFFASEQPEYVVLAAGKVGGILENVSHPFEFITTNNLIQSNIFTAAARSGVKKLIFFGSSCMYPRDCSQPMPESLLLTGLPELTSLAYATSKLAGVQTCLAYNKEFGIDRFIPVIPSSVFGPNDNFDPKSSHVISGLISKFHDAKVNAKKTVMLWGTGLPRREFVYSDDVADAGLRLLSDDIELDGGPLNIGAGKDISIKELAEMVSLTVGYKGSIEWDRAKPDGSMRKLLDSSKFYRTGWSPSVDLEAGLRRTYEWFLKHKIY